MGPEFEEQEEREFDVGVEDPELIEDEPEVEVASEEPEAEPEPEEEPAPAEEPEEKPKRSGRLQQRLENLARRAAEAEAALERERQQRLQYEQQLAAERTAQFGQMEIALKAEIAAAKRELIDAKQAGDYATEVELTTKLSKLTADLSAVETFRSQAPRQEQPAPQQERQAQPQQAPQVAPETAAWIAANPWFVPNNPEYDEEMAVEAQFFARKLEARLKREGRANDIGSREYFQVIDEHLRGQFADAFEDSPPPRPKTPPMRAAASVAPVARQTAPMQPKAKSNVVKLTAAEREMAELMSPHLPREKAWAEYARYK